MSQPADSSKVIRFPLVLALDCGPLLLARCREVAARSRLVVRACEAVSAWQVAVRMRPLAIVLPSHLHARAPHTFELLATESGARLVVVESDQLPHAELAGHLAQAARAARG